MKACTDGQSQNRNSIPLWNVLMGSRKFWSWPAGWRNALPWSVLFGVLVVAAFIVFEGLRSGWNSLDRLFWVDTAMIFFVVVVGFMAFTARLCADRNQEDKLNP